MKQFFVTIHITKNVYIYVIESLLTRDIYHYYKRTYTYSSESVKDSMYC